MSQHKNVKPTNESAEDAAEKLMNEQLKKGEVEGAGLGLFQPVIDDTAAKKKSKEPIAADHHDFDVDPKSPRSNADKLKLYEEQKNNDKREKEKEIARTAKAKR